MKIIGSLLILIATVVASFFYEKGYKDRLSKIKSVIGFISYIRTQIEYFSHPLSEIYNNYQEMNDFLLTLTKAESNDFGLDKQEFNIIREFFSSLGKGYKKEQISLCDYTIKELNKIYETQERDYPNKIKIFRSMSIFIGVSAIILLV